MHVYARYKQEHKLMTICAITEGANHKKKA